MISLWKGPQMHTILADANNYTSNIFIIWMIGILIIQVPLILNLIKQPILTFFKIHLKLTIDFRVCDENER